MSTLRHYQIEAISAVLAHWGRGVQAVCLVAPTGSGKTRMCEELLAGNERSLWIAHQRDLVAQTADQLRQRFGHDRVGVIMPGAPSNESARVQVATIQTLLARDLRPLASRIVLDEAHHYLATDWRCLLAAYPEASIVGPTATPERGDGAPLGDMFEELVVAANYSELIRGKFLVPARLLQPSTHLGADIATSPFDAWLAHARGERAFVFCARVDIAKEEAARFRAAGVAAEAIDAKSPRQVRERNLDGFRRGAIRVITNVATMTEGIDVPEAACAILARGFGHTTAYLQSCGRVLRPAHGKSRAIVIDLVGSSLTLGHPASDREYSLAGRRGIARGDMPSPAPATMEGGAEHAAFEQGVRNVPLVEAAPARALWLPSEEDGPAERKRIYAKLRADAIARGQTASVASIWFRDRFGHYPPMDWRT